MCLVWCIILCISLQVFKGVSATTRSREAENLSILLHMHLCFFFQVSTHSSSPLILCHISGDRLDLWLVDQYCCLICVSAKSQEEFTTILTWWPIFQTWVLCSLALKKKRWCHWTSNCTNMWEQTVLLPSTYKDHTLLQFLSTYVALTSSVTWYKRLHWQLCFSV